MQRSMGLSLRLGLRLRRGLGRRLRVCDRLRRYRRGGLGALRPRKQPGRRPKLTPQQEEQLKARLDAGPRDSDGVCTLRGRDVCRIIEREFGVVARDFEGLASQLGC